MRSLFLYGNRVLLPVEAEMHNCHVSVKRFRSTMAPYDIIDRRIVVYLFHLESILVIEMGGGDWLQEMMLLKAHL